MAMKNILDQNEHIPEDGIGLKHNTNPQMPSNTGTPSASGYALGLMPRDSPGSLGMSMPFQSATLSPTTLFSTAVPDSQSTSLMPIDDSLTAGGYENALASLHRASSLQSQSLSDLDDLKIYMPAVTSSTNVPRHAQFINTASSLAAFPEGARPTIGPGGVQGVFNASSMGSVDSYQDMMGHVTGWSV